MHGLTKADASNRAGNPDIRTSGNPDFRISGYPGNLDFRFFRKSGNPDFRISGYPEIRKFSHFLTFSGNSGNTQVTLGSAHYGAIGWLC